MQVATATAPESAAPCSDQNNQVDDTTICGLCGAEDSLKDYNELPVNPKGYKYSLDIQYDAGKPTRQAERHVYQLGDGRWVCVEHIGLVVSLAANDLFSDMVSYSKAFERVLM